MGLTKNFQCLCTINDLGHFSFLTVPEDMREMVSDALEDDDAIGIKHPWPLTGIYHCSVTCSFDEDTCAGGIYDEDIYGNTYIDISVEIGARASVSDAALKNHVGAVDAA